jgi:hypothetical protein
VIDVPLVTATATQYDEYVVECACWRLHTAPLPTQASVPGTVTYGLNIQAWCVFLLAARHVPVARCAEIIASLSGIRPSDGFVHAFKACQVSVAGTKTGTVHITSSARISIRHLAYSLTVRWT